jgi:hypothetical protein
VTSPGAQHDLDTSLVGPTQGVTVFLRKFDLGIEQGAIDVNGDKTDGALHSFILPSDKDPRLDCSDAVLLVRHIGSPQKPNRDKRKNRIAPAPSSNVK